MILTEVFKNSFCEALRPEETITVSEWANEHRILPPTTSSEPGRYDVARTPYLKEIMDVLTINNGINLVVFKKSAQVGGSEAGNNWLGYIMDIAPASTMVVQPTVEMAKKYSQQRIDPMIEYTPRIRNKVGNSKVGDNKVLSKKIPNGVINIVGANSPAPLRSTPVKFLFFDEVDAAPLDCGGEGDPFLLVKQRLRTYADHKIFLPSTPTIDGASVVEREFLLGDQRYYNVPCPRCGFFQKLVFNQMRYQLKNEDSSVSISGSTYYECIDCKYEIKEYHKTEMFNKGKWIAENLEAQKNVRSYHISTLYSPVGWESWENLVNAYLRSKNDPFLYKTFVNTMLGETYKEKVFRPDWKTLYDRKEDYGALEASKEIIYCCAGVDTQNDRLEAIVLGFSKNNNIQVLDYKVFLGDTKQQKVWQDLAKYIYQDVKHPVRNLPISDVAIDTGGSATWEVYNFCRTYRDKCYAIKGASHAQVEYMKNGNAVTKTKEGVRFNNPLQLYLINTILSKKTIYTLLDNHTDTNSRYVRFPAHLEENFFKMLTSEYMYTRIINGRQSEDFKKPNNDTRNEALDCFVYAYALAASRNYSAIVTDEYKKLYKKLFKINYSEDESEKNEEALLSKPDQDLNSVAIKRESKKRINSFNKKGLGFNKRV